MGLFSSAFFHNYLSLELLVRAVLLFTVYYFLSLNYPLAKGIFLFYFLGFIVYLLFLFEYHQYFGFLVFTEISLIFFLCNLCLAFFNYMSTTSSKITPLLIFLLFLINRRGFYVYEFYTNYLDSFSGDTLNDLSAVMMMLSYNILFIFSIFHILFIVFFIVFRFSFQELNRNNSSIYVILKTFDVIITSIFEPSVRKFK